MSILFLLALVFEAQSQDNKLAVKADQKLPADFFQELSLQSGINIIYSDNLLEKLDPITLVMKGVTIDEILHEVLSGTQVGYRYVEEQVVLYFIDPPVLKYSISGLVTDSVSGEPLISAYVYDETSGKSTMTNEYGYFSLYLPAGEVRILSGYSGFVQQKRVFDLIGNQIIQLRLAPNAVLPEVIVTEFMYDYNDHLIEPAETMTYTDLQSDIQLGGASDLYRAADFIPGVHTGTDGVGGIHVRGGANDQNLILMDGVPVYHPNHLLGIVSVFNYQVLQQASIYKANFPSKFSGRLSSVMDVRTREGNINQWAFSGNVGLSELGALAEGPLVPGKVGILVTGRFFLPGLIMRDLTMKVKERNGIEGFTDIDYFDFNGKINWKIGLRNRLYLSMYRGSDMFSDFTITDRDEIDNVGTRIISHEEYDKNLNWSNRTGVFRWNFILSDKIFSNLIISTSSFVLQSIDKRKFNYSFPGTERDTLSGFDTKEFKSGISDVTAKLELDIRPSTDHKLNAGIYGIQYVFQPKSISHNEESKIGDFYLKEGLLDDILFVGFKVRALEAGVYMEDNWEINKKFLLSSGIHISGFFVQKTYYLDPQLRMSLEYQLAPAFAVSLGYSRMAQYLHNLTSSSIGLPTDLWVPTTSKASPALSDQYSFSALWKPAGNLTIDFSAYLKDMRKLISYQEGASFLLREGPLAGSIIDAGNWETKITEGDGTASGVELQFIYDIQKLRFKLNGTWSRSFRRFDDINNGLPFPDRFDRRWSSTFSGQYQLGPKWSASLNFLYGTGIAITLAESIFFNPGSVFPEIGINYSERNGFRLPSYHRMDITINYQIARKERFNHSLSLNLYNVYNRTNPFYITLVQDPFSQIFQVKQFSLFKFFPSLTYRFAFQ
jgi:outer membrane receptor for ferrienterochelin and colicin